MLIELEEYGPTVEVRLPSATAAAIRECGLVQVTPSADARTWVLQPQGKVGVVAIDGIQIRVAPKLPIHRIVFLLSYQLRGVTWEQEVVSIAHEKDFVEVLVDIFMRAISEAIRGGLLQGYRTVEAALPVVRGRIRTDEQLKRRPGVWLPIEVAFDEFTVDIPENQLLRAAIERLQRLPVLSRQRRRQLAALRLQFAEVSRTVPGTPVPEVPLNRLNLRYESALRLAKLILASTSFEHRSGSSSIEGFILDLPRIYEDFVGLAVRDAVRAHAAELSTRLQFRTSLDEAALIPIRPDIVLQTPAGVVVAVMDAKYKAEKPSGFPQADLYQALAYASALSLPEAHLIYAKGDQPTGVFNVRHGGPKIHVHCLDLTAPPEGVLQQVAGVVTNVYGSTIDVLVDAINV